MPVDVITHDQIASSGYTETAQVIQSLAPSFNFPRPTITDGTDTVRPATLRGLGPDQVLVLINGKRRHQSALVHLNGSIGRGSTGVDLNAIPVSAIDHIEVLRDGAAAQYGSDAIAGVINIVLKGGVARAERDVELRPVEGIVRGQPVHAGRPGVHEGSDIDFSDGGLFDVGGSWGLAAGKGSVTVAAEYRHHNRTNRASFDPRDQIVAGDAGNNAVAEPNHRWGDPDTRDIDDVPQRQRAAERSRRPASSTPSAATAAATANSAGFYRRALDVRNWPQIYPLGFLPVIEPTVVDASGTAGIRGVSREVELRRQRPVRAQQLRLHDRRHAERVARPDVPPNKTTFDAGTLELNQFVGNVDVSRAVHGRRPCRSAERRLRRRVSPRELPDPAPASRTRIATAASRTSSATVRPSARRCFPASVRRTRSTRRATACAGYVDVEGDVTQLAAPRRRRTRRALQRLRQHGRRQGDRARAARPALRRARLGEHRLPRAVARAVVLLVDRDELPRTSGRASCRWSR